MRRGFTIIEILVVVGVIVILFSLGIGSFSKTAQRQFILFREQNKLVSALDKAKYLAFSTFGQEQAPCGFGVRLEASNNTIIIFKELPVSGNDCASIDNVYTPPSGPVGGDEIVETIKLDQDVRFNNLTLSNVVFIPPAPQIIINGDSNIQSASAEIVDSGGATVSSVIITKTGQITSQMSNQVSNPLPQGPSNSSGATAGVMDFGI